MWYCILMTALACYFIGNLNGAVCISRLVAKEDVRTHGSGNAGFTNFVRNFGFASGLMVALIDIAKAALACFIGAYGMAPHCRGLEGMMLGTVAVTLGHDFPVFLGFRGGKGILCCITAAYIMDWRAASIVLGVFILVYLVFGYVSLASVMGAVAYGITFVVFHYDDPLVMIGGIFLAALAIFMHRGNIVRLCKGTEPRTSLLKKEKKS